MFPRHVLSVVFVCLIAFAGCGDGDASRRSGQVIDDDGAEIAALQAVRDALATESFKSDLGDPWATEALVDLQIDLFGVLIPTFPEFPAITVQKSTDPLYGGVVEVSGNTLTFVDVTFESPLPDELAAELTVNGELTVTPTTLNGELTFNEYVEVFQTSAVTVAEFSNITVDGDCPTGGQLFIDYDQPGLNTDISATFNGCDDITLRD